MRFESYNNSCTGSHPNLSNITLQWLLNAIQKKFVCEPERDKRIRVKPSIKQKKKLNQQTKVSVCVIKDNSISLLEFVFDLNFDEIIFLENPIKIVQNKDKAFLEFNSIMDSLKSYHHIINYLNK